MAAMKETTKNGMNARNAAVRRLVAAHKDEYTRILGDERESLGLSRTPVSSDPQVKLQRRKEKLEEQLAKVRQELGEDN